MVQVIFLLIPVLVLTTRLFDWGDFQFITWSKDKTLRFRQTHHWQDVLQSAGHGQPPDMALPPGGQGYFKQAMLSRLSRPPLDNVESSLM
ncbi:hypothetical protein BJV78DRAFT_1288929 [Lactifluus subvellereus]|nr:hypothetical protein BJV78DRAFT_1288929 [Lactifluus subvellereus]